MTFFLHLALIGALWDYAVHRRPSAGGLVTLSNKLANEQRP